MFRRERSAMLGVATPQGAQVDLTLERTADGTFSVIDAAVSEDGGVAAAVQDPELAGIVDALTPAFAEQGLRIEIGGDGEREDSETDDARPAPGSREHRSHNNPPDLIEDEEADVDGPVAEDIDREVAADAEETDIDDEARGDDGLRNEDEAETKPDPEGMPTTDLDPLIDLTEQILAGEILKKGLIEDPKARQILEQTSREFVSQMRRLFPDGIDKPELKRIIKLGLEADGPKFRSLEAATGVRLEQELGVNLVRSPDSAYDWVDPVAGTTYDAVLGNMPARFYTLERARSAIQEHVRKSVDKIVIDLHHLSRSQAFEVIEYVKTQLPAGVSERILILE